MKTIILLLLCAGIGSMALASGAKTVTQAEVKDFTKTESGLQYQVLKEGKGRQPGATAKVEVHYEGKLPNGKVFDSSYKRGKPIQFKLNQVIKGWTEGVQLMKEGATYKFIIPPHLGYGQRGAGNVIPPNATLIFKVELIRIVY